MKRLNLFIVLTIIFLFFSKNNLSMDPLFDYLQSDEYLRGVTQEKVTAEQFLIEFKKEVKDIYESPFWQGVVFWVYYIAKFYSTSNTNPFLLDTFTSIIPSIKENEGIVTFLSRLSPCVLIKFHILGDTDPYFFSLVNFHPEKITFVPQVSVNLWTTPTQHGEGFGLWVNGYSVDCNRNNHSFVNSKASGILFGCGLATVTASFGYFILRNFL